MVFRILLMINVQGAVFELAHCLTRRAHSEQAACLPACRNFVVCLVTMVQLCIFPPPSFFFPPLFPSLLSCRLLWMW